MKHKKAFLLRLAALLSLAALSASCTTTYDAYGRPVQSVDPALAVAGVAAAGIIGYAIADNNRGNYRGNNRYANYDRGYRGHGGYHGRDCRY
jgi:hypothetical protein